ncbi:MAG TPA: BMP family ABC transporter substrate-binding protein, partial [Firmicutes bacterium]|nr:BMP family ABC transporter substrate-binding protein [Bacillota bacterium]
MKRIGLVLVLLVLFSAVASAAPLKVALLINGTLGDRSFFDSAYDGMQMAQEELGIQARIIEMSYDQSVWEPTLA